MANYKKLALFVMRDEGFLGQRISEEAPALELEVDVFSHTDLTCEIRNNHTTFYAGGKEIDFAEYSGILINETSQHPNLTSALIAHITYKYPSIKLLNKNAYMLFPGNYTKLAQFMVLQDKVPLIDTFVTSSTESLTVQVEKAKGELSNHDTILKPLKGSRGKNVFLLSHNDYQEKMDKEKASYFLLQPALKIMCDYRIIVLGGKVLGVMKREKATADAVTTNYARGGTVSHVETTQEFRELSLAAAEALKLDYAGVDIIVDEETGKSYILEVNRFAHFKGFESVTGVNVTKEILLYMSQP